MPDKPTRKRRKPAKAKVTSVVLKKLKVPARLASYTYLNDAMTYSKPNVEGLGTKTQLDVGVHEGRVLIQNEGCEELIVIEPHVLAELNAVVNGKDS